MKISNLEVRFCSSIHIQDAEFPPVLTGPRKYQLLRSELYPADSPIARPIPHYRCDRNYCLGSTYAISRTSTPRITFNPPPPPHEKATKSTHSCGRTSGSRRTKGTLSLATTLKPSCFQSRSASRCSCAESTTGWPRSPAPGSCRATAAGPAGSGVRSEGYRRAAATAAASPAAESRPRVNTEDACCCGDSAAQRGQGDYQHLAFFTLLIYKLPI